MGIPEALSISLNLTIRGSYICQVSSKLRKLFHRRCYDNISLTQSKMAAGSHIGCKTGPILHKAQVDTCIIEIATAKFL